MKKWMVSLSAATLLTIAACGNDSEDNQDTNDNGANQETQENTADTNEETTTNDTSGNMVPDPRCSKVLTHWGSGTNLSY